MDITVKMIVIGAIIASAGIDWIKDLLKKVTVPTWVWSVLLPILSFGVASFYAYKAGSWDNIVIYTAAIWTVGQFGYQTISQTVKGIVKTVLAGGTVAGLNTSTIISAVIDNIKDLFTKSKDTTEVKADGNNSSSNS